jgi:RNA polymerase sigma-70 factor (ECF subfamily)
MNLVRRMLAGDEQAFDEFFEAYFPGLYRFALARMRNDADAAEEVVQATLVAALSKLRTYRGEATLFTWLCAFCRYEIAGYYKRTHRHPVTVELADQNPEVMAALESLWVLTQDGPDAVLQRREVGRLVHVVLDQLPPRYAEALEWKYIDGFSVNEIAGRLSVSPKAAESLLTRARDAFRDGFSTLMGRSFA